MTCLSDPMIDIYIGLFVIINLAVGFFLLGGRMAKKWPAYQKWTMEYIKEVVGDVEVPLYDSSKADPAAPINSSAMKMKFADYIDLIQREPTNLRIFFFDPIKNAKKLLEYLMNKVLMLLINIKT